MPCMTSPNFGLSAYRETAANGADVASVQALMRHANASATMNTYVEAVRQRKGKRSGGSWDYWAPSALPPVAGRRRVRSHTSNTHFRFAFEGKQNDRRWNPSVVFRLTETDYSVVIRRALKKRRSRSENCRTGGR